MLHLELVKRIGELEAGELIPVVLKLIDFHSRVRRIS